MKLKSKQESSLFRKLSVPIVCLFVIQAIVLLLVVRFFALSDLRNNTHQIVLEKVISRKNEMQNSFITKWTKLDVATEQINTFYSEMEDSGKDLWSSETQIETQAELLLKSYETLVSVLRQNSVNGVFLILSQSKEYTAYEEGATRWGIGIRDYDCESSYLESEDIVAVRSPVSIQKLSLCSADAGWDNIYKFNSKKSSEFFYKPLEQAFNNPEAKSFSLEYYSEEYCLDGDYGNNVISYTVPLISDGQPYGVLGVELTTKYIKGLLPNRELGEVQNVAYILARTDSDYKDYSVLVQNGSYYTQSFGSKKTVSRSKEVKKQAYSFENVRNNDDTIGFVSDFELYNANSPFEQEKLVLIGILDYDTLYSDVNRVGMVFFIASLLTLVIGLVGILIVSKVITDPIKKLALEVDEYDVDGENEKLRRLGVAEIDGLISAIEQMNKRMAENLAKTEFFARMSHDMRTPMNAIIGFSEDNILKDASDEQKLDYFNKINVSGKYLLALINDVLDMSKIDSGKLTMFNENVEFGELWRSTLPIIEKVANKKGVNLEANGIDQLSKLVLIMDKYRMQQVFINLLSNAVKFTPSGGSVTIDVKVVERDDESIKIEYKVTDTGCGIDEKFLKNLYKPFEQENPGEGTGLGLAICKNIVRILNGTIDCESVKGKGTSFTVVMSHKIVHEKTNEAKLAVETNTFLDLKGKRVLLCEDNIINKKIAELQLEKVGMEVDHAEDGNIAVEKFVNSSENYYDIILMDIRMPNKNGLEATKSIRAQNRPDAKSVPIIAMTANAFAEDRIASQNAGMNDHLAKPISSTMLYRTLKKYLEK